LVYTKEMGRTKHDEIPIRKITKLGKRSYGVTIPIEYMRQLNWREKQKVVVELKGKRITIRDSKKRP
jgi:antitoxin component of MazEF toxin-antitoxin module